MGEKIRIPISVAGNDEHFGPFMKIIDTPEFERLREIKQLDMTYKVFPGATHTRFEHSLGTMHHERNILNSIERNGCFDFDSVEKKTAELAALVHDMGHPPFSHAAEFALIYFGQPDHNEKTTETVRSIEDTIGKIEGIDSGLLFKILEKKDPLHKTIKSLAGSDSIDYIIRDAESCGIPANSDTSRLEAYAVFDGNDYGIDTKASESVRSHAQSYIHMYTDVYNRKSVAMLKSQLRRAIYELLNSGKENAENIWHMTDCELLSKLLKSGEIPEKIYIDMRERKIPKSFMSLKMEGMKSQEETRKKPIYSCELSDEEMFRIMHAFEGMENIVEFEDSVAREIGSGKGSVFLCDMPHIQKMYPRDVSLYNIDEGWTSLFSEIPLTKKQFAEDLRRKYAIRVGIDEPYRRLAYEKSGKVMDILESFI